MGMIDLRKFSEVSAGSALYGYLLNDSQSSGFEVFRHYLCIAIVFQALVKEVQP